MNSSIPVVRVVAVEVGIATAIAVVIVVAVAIATVIAVVVVIAIEIVPTVVVSSVLELPTVVCVVIGALASGIVSAWKNSVVATATVVAILAMVEIGSSVILPTGLCMTD